MPRTALAEPLSNVKRSDSMWAISSGNSTGKCLLTGDPDGGEADAVVPRTTTPSCPVRGSRRDWYRPGRSSSCSMTSSAISASQPSLSFACTQRHEFCEAVSAGVWPCDMFLLRWCMRRETAPSSVALRMSPSPVRSPAAVTLVVGRAAEFHLSYSSVFGLRVPGDDDGVRGEVAAGSAAGFDDGAVGDDLFDGCAARGRSALRRSSRSMCSVLRLLPISGAMVLPGSRTETSRSRAARNSASSRATRSAPTIAALWPSASILVAVGRRPSRTGRCRRPRSVCSAFSQGLSGLHVRQVVAGMVGSTTWPPLATTTASG